MNDREYYEKFGEMPENAENSSWTSTEVEMSDKSYAQLLAMNAAIREENAMLERGLKEAERENEYIVAILATVAIGLTTIQFYLGQLGTMEMVPVMPPYWLEAWQALKTSVKLTEKPIKKWEDDLEKYNSVPF